MPHHFWRGASGGEQSTVSDRRLAAEVVFRYGVHVIAGETAGQEDEKPRSDLNRQWRAIRKRAGIEDVRIHDLRHSFASIGAGSDLGLPIIGRLLGHTQASTTQRYAHIAVNPAKRAADLIAGKIADAMSEK